MRKKSSSTSAAESAPVENVPHQPRAHVCHRCGAEIAADGDREHGPEGAAHPLPVCFDNVKAERDELRAVIAASAEPEPKKAAKK